MPIRWTALCDVLVADSMLAQPVNGVTALRLLETGCPSTINSRTSLVSRYAVNTPTTSGRADHSYVACPDALKQDAGHRQSATRPRNARHSKRGGNELGATESAGRCPIKAPASASAAKSSAPPSLLSRLLDRSPQLCRYTEDHPDPRQFLHVLTTHDGTMLPVMSRMHTEHKLSLSRAIVDIAP